MNIEVERSDMIDVDLSGLRLQPGFVEGIVCDRKRFSMLQEAYQHIFRNNLEYAILLWNGIPIRFEYQTDLAAIIDDLIAMLRAVQDFELDEYTPFQFRSANIGFVWKVITTAEYVTITAEWVKVPGGYEAALNKLGMIQMLRLDFMCEWKLLLKQFIQAIDDAESDLTEIEAQEKLNIMRSLEEGIPNRGLFYQY